ncbi:hypothetical protein ASG51_00960 [Methylobacterium sp. Leaf465]|uniref:hypothetical protein n=1 Tax=Methylobacterium sp. Leaf465 TaxID=1736385 RepID=UPI0006FF7022|nr:hypothetical protein [Methylobacterium sp. Leaf465]KQT84695.1 hypothetical protein ASG51_00960 [Methylobacterium sp. Leaf465]
MDDLPEGFRVVSAPQSPPGDDMPAGFRVVSPPAAPAPEAPSVALDVAKAAPVGVAKGTIGLAGLPGDVQEMGGSLVDRIMLGVGHKVMDWTGYGPQAGTPERADFDRMYTGIGSGGGLPTSGAIQRGVETATGPFYKPQTTAGAYAQTVGEFAPSAVIGPGGLVRKIMETAVPAVASETAGQATKGSAAEPAARLIGAIMGGTGTAAVRARADAHDRTIRAAIPRGMTEAEWQASQGVADTGRRIGVDLTGPEAVQQGTGGATKLADVQRFVEGSPQSAALTGMMAARPDQMRAAVGNALDTVAPQSALPSTLGPRAAETATTAIDDVRQGINAATRPAYAAAGRHVLDPADFDPIARDPAFQASLRRLRNDEVLGPTYRDQPDNAVGVIDAVTKDMRDRGVALGNAANPGFSSQTAGLYGNGAAEARAIARDPARGGVQAYDDALTAQAQARQQNLAPLEQGPLGRVAEATSTDAAGRAVLPGAGSPHLNVGGQGELADAVTRLAARDPDLTAQLIRQRLANQADTSMTRLVGGEAQGGGARYAKDIAGTDQQAANLQAVLSALPNSPGARAAMEDLLQTLRATGQRKPQGSPTDFNAQYRAEIGAETLPQQASTALRTGGRSLLSNVGDATRRAYLGRNNERLAETFAAPDSVERLKAIIMRGAETPFTDAALRALIMAPMAINSR